MKGKNENEKTHHQHSVGGMPDIRAAACRRSCRKRDLGLLRQKRHMELQRRNENAVHQRQRRHDGL